MDLKRLERLMKPTSRLLLTLVTLALLPCLTLNVFGSHIAIAVPLPATLDQLVNADGTNKAGTYIPVDGNALSRFTYSSTGDMPAPSQIDITQTPQGKLRFSGAFIDLPGGPGNGASDATLQFDVEGDPDPRQYTGITLAGNPSVGTGSGIAQVTETLSNTGLPEPIQLDILSEDMPTNMPIRLETSADFSSSIPSFTVVKNIQLLTTDNVQPATVSFIDQGFIPEPTGLTLTLLGFLGLTGALRRR